MARKLNIGGIDESVLTIAFATAIAYKSMELDDFLNPMAVDVWNRHINQAHMLHDFLMQQGIITSTVQCVECGLDFPTAAGAAACARADKADHDAIMETTFGCDE